MIIFATQDNNGEQILRTNYTIVVTLVITLSLVIIFWLISYEDEDEYEHEKKNKVIMMTMIRLMMIFTDFLYEGLLFRWFPNDFLDPHIEIHWFFCEFQDQGRQKTSEGEQHFFKLRVEHFVLVFVKGSRTPQKNIDPSSEIGEPFVGNDHRLSEKRSRKTWHFPPQHQHHKTQTRENFRNRVDKIC